MTTSLVSLAYQNPVHPFPCADPFVLKHAGEYWCYCTGLRRDGRAFGMLHSPDLVHWRDAGSVLDRLGEAVVGVPDTCYWAPEVTYYNGLFYFYYSVGNETYMHMRVAVAEHPGGPFRDSGRRLTQQDFAIDGHVFTDDDGTRYMFYATDFLEHSHIGTGTVVDRLVSPLELAGQPQPVSRARFDWQVYDPQRLSKGGVRWHTIEGPFVLKRKGRYYQMFSGGNWQDVTYGVSYATSHAVMPQGEWEQAADGQQVLPILRTLPEAGVIGPGHNSVVRGPDNRQLFCIYHRWLPEINDRVLAIDRLDWLGEGLVVLGPTTTPQPAPNRPSLAGFGPAWEIEGGDWALQGNRARLSPRAGRSAAASLRLPAEDFRLEATIAAGSPAQGAGAAAYGLALHGAAGEVLRVDLRPETISVEVAANGQTISTPLPEGFQFAADHLLGVDVKGAQARVWLDDAALRWQGTLASAPGRLALTATGAPASFAGVELTTGWEDNFDQEHLTLEAAGWQARQGAAAPAGVWKIASQQLWQTRPEAPEALLVKAAPAGPYEVVVNARLDCLDTSGNGRRRQDYGYGCFPAMAGADEPGPRVSVEPGTDGGWQLTAEARGGRQVFTLPPDFDAYAYQQFRFRWTNGRLSLQWKALPLGEVAAPAEPRQVGLHTRHCGAAFDMVRVTALA